MDALPWPVNAEISWLVPSALLFVVWVATREISISLAAHVMSMVAPDLMRSDPRALFGTTMQGGMRPPGWRPQPGPIVAQLNVDELTEQAASCVFAVHRAWARQDAISVRELLARSTWTVFSMLVDASRQRRRGGIPLQGFEIRDGRVLGCEDLPGLQAATLRFDIAALDPPTLCQQDWSFERRAGQRWLLVAVDPVRSNPRELDEPRPGPWVQPSA